MERPRKVLLLRRGPAEPATTGTLELAEVLRSQGHIVHVALIQDAVLCAVNASGLESAWVLRGLVGTGVGCHVLADDLLMRGYKRVDVLPCCRLIDYGALVDLLLADGASVAGAF
ncbi:MAG: hypothetical protein HY331_15965 [Chloroflexi bacterium]|nr:hypothetical protein [Chloroflexota bacterium]